MQTRLLVGLALLTVTVAARNAAPPVTIHGRITDSNGNALPGANVASRRPALAGANSDASGHYSFSIVPASANDTVILIARRVGYQPTAISIPLNGRTD